MKRTLKRLTEAALLFGGPAHVASRVRSGRRLIVAYHNVVDEPVERGDPSLHLPRESFAAQLDSLVAVADVVPLEQLLDVPSAGDPRPRVSITFDDAYLGALTLGFEELARRSLPATVFVTPGLLEGTAFWWDLAGSDVPVHQWPELRERLLEEKEGRQERIISWLHSRGADVPMPDPVARSVTQEELSAASAQPGITLASHSWSHPNLTCLRPEELQGELVRPSRWLRERYDNVIPWLAYPYGLHSSGVRQAAADAGYVSAIAVTGGWIAQDPPDRFALPRLNVPAGMSANGFRLRLAGLLC